MTRWRWPIIGVLILLSALAVWGGILGLQPSIYVRLSARH